MKRLTSILLGVCVFSALTYASVVQKQFIVHFPSDSFSLNSAAHAELSKAIAFAKSGSYFEVSLDAHTDHDGSNQYNVELSKNRAASVCEYLVASGIDKRRIQFSWFGEKKPVQTNTTLQGKQANRRVTVSINIYEWESADEMLADISEKPQQFSINPAVKATVQTSSGVKIEVPANAFETKNGMPVTAENVTLTIEEALSKESWLLEGLTTMAPEGILESGGMFRIEAQQNGEALALREGMQINAQVPFQKAAEGMTLFYANTDSSGNMLWQDSQQPVQAKLNVELPAMQMDTRQLDALITKYNQARYGYPQCNAAFYELKPRPEFKMKEPRMPKKPVKEQVRINVSGFKKMFMTKKQKQVLIEKAYEKRMRVYEKNLAYYNKRLNIYKQRKAAFEKAAAEFDANYPEYDQILREAIAVMDSLKTAYQKGIATERIEKTLVALKYKLSKGITDPNYITRLVDTYGYNWYHTDNRVYRTQYPLEINAIATKLDELGLSRQDKTQYTDWAIGYQFRTIWKADAQLMALLSDSERQLMEERLNSGVGNYTDMSGYYTAALSNMGWINIDKFAKMNLTASLTIHHDPGARVFIILNDQNSVLNYWGSTMNVPRYRSFTIFSVTLKGNTPYYAIQKVKTNEKATEVMLEYQEGLVEDIKEAAKKAAV